MCGGWLGNFVDDVFGGIADVVSDVVEDVVDFAEDVFGGVTDVVGDVLEGTANIVNDALKSVATGIKEVGGIIGDTLKVVIAGLDAAVDYAGAILKDPKQIYTDLDGSFDLMKTISFAAAAIFAVPSLGASVAAWVATYGGSVNAMTAKMVKNGWINTTTAMVVNIIGNGLLAYANFGGYLPQGSAMAGTIAGLEAIGVSSETAFQVGLFVQRMSQYVYIAQSVMTGYGIYKTYQSILDMERDLKTKEAEINAWINNMKMKSEKEDQFIFSFVNGSYFKKLPGQPLFNVYLAGRERFIPVNVQKPSWWIEGYWAYGEDIEIASLMWDDKNFNKPGGSNFMNTLKN